ncbi:hypothetical protein GcM3_214016 [Golovinomyces cichoracearum]|uniref:Uncharacterized protein n=1 Tax=Golovinomyces cichoracearum TaxID=62708 RepID=A0A420H935_9PEZI|nr:hypothetical protein GcM3_214016 [Golovinomyces cichoracearum]
MCGSLLDLAHTDYWPTLAEELIDWVTIQGFVMDSSSIGRMENGKSPEWTSEELCQIREQKR